MKYVFAIIDILAIFDTKIKCKLFLVILQMSCHEELEFALIIFEKMGGCLVLLFPISFVFLFV
jgi:hypothetical protein